jgi:ferredoxin
MVHKHKIRIEYTKGHCVSAMTCIRASPHHFELKEGKAHLKGSSHHSDDKFILETECDDEYLKKVVQAATACPVNAIKVIDKESGEAIVSDAIKIIDGVKHIEARYDDLKEFILDKKGYFLIRIVPDKKLIEVGFCGSKNKIELIVFGKKPIDVYTNILREDVISRPEHAAYLGRELQKAYIALQLGLPYVQDDELDFSKLK